MLLLAEFIESFTGYNIMCSIFLHSPLHVCLINLFHLLTKTFKTCPWAANSKFIIACMVCISFRYEIKPATCETHLHRTELRLNWILVAHNTVFLLQSSDNSENTGAWIDYSHLHLGFGMTSSGTGVQIDSGDFCSLNLPSNTAASCSMSKAHTAEPGMLGRQRQRGETEVD